MRLLATRSALPDCGPARRGATLRALDIFGTQLGVVDAGRVGSPISRPPSIDITHSPRPEGRGTSPFFSCLYSLSSTTGWPNGFAFPRAVRSFFDGPLVLAGGISDGQALWGARALGCDLAYMGTPFIATDESLAGADYKAMLKRCQLDNVMLTSAFTGLPISTPRPSIVANGLDPERLPTDMQAERAAELYGGFAEGDGPRRWSDIWSAGHSVSGVTAVCSVAARVAQIRAEYGAARVASQSLP